MKPAIYFSNTVGIVVTFLCLGLFACTNQPNDYVNADTAFAKEVSYQFSSIDIYKELVRRSQARYDTPIRETIDTMATILTDQLKNIQDTLSLTKTYDTVLPAKVKMELGKISDKELFNAYNLIIKKRRAIKGIESIYGDDNRRDITIRSPQSFKSSGQCVFAMIDKRCFDFTVRPVKLKPQETFKDAYQLCEGERFSMQSVFAHCTAFAVSQTKVASAGHCVSSKDYSKYLLIADFREENINNYINVGIPQENVYEITGMDSPDYDSIHDEKDYSVFTVNKVIPNWRIAKLSNRASLKQNDEFYVIGFPCGLSMKVCDKSRFRYMANSAFFVISADTYGGNSGSPVFNQESSEVEGILVRGNDDFRLEIDDCRKSIRCPEMECRGEDVTRITLIKPFIK